ncbi:MAG: DUF4132 domain-containing protein [Propionibacteriaceae bacterium]|jgi:hypothetical protein|nr:DUF4132 domain-containing protein [Propionibacteriaceae bacterium]
MFDKLKRLLGGDPAPPGVVAWLRPLRRQNPALADAVGDFVARGGEAGGGLGLGADALDVVDQACAGDWAFAGLKKLSDGTKMRPDQWVRLGEVLALTPTYAGRGSPDGPPAWFLALQDALWRSMASPLHWAPEFVHGVLAAGGVPDDRRPHDVVACFFAVLAPVESEQDPFRWWLTGSPRGERRVADGLEAHPGVLAVADYVGAHLDAVPGALAGLGADRRLTGLSWLESFPRLVAGLAPMLGEFSVGSSKPVRGAALRLIATLPDPVFGRTMAAALDQGEPAWVGDAIDFLARAGDRGGRAIIEAALAQGRGGKRDALLATALGRIKAVTDSGPELVLPPLPPLDDTPLGWDFLRDLEAAVARTVANLERQSGRLEAIWARERAARLKNLGPGDFEATRAWLSGKRQRPSCMKHESHILLSALDLPLLPAVRASVDVGADRSPLSAYHVEWLVDKGHDLRSVVAAARAAGVTDPVGDAAAASFSRRDDPALIWPFYAEHPEAIDQWLGLAPRRRDFWGDPVAVGLRLLGMFPAIPARHLPVLAELATGEAKTHRRTAQELLELRPDCVNLALSALGHSKAEIRATAAAWLGRLGDPAAVAPLRGALATERGEQAQAAMLTALSALGDDVSAHVTPEALGAKAAKGLKGKLPAGLSWFPLDALPACRWADGTPVDPVVVRWWAVLAAKLKDPGGAELIPLYVSLLDQPSRETLGAFALDAWVAQDTAHPADEVCRAHAAADVDARHAGYQAQAKRWPRDFAALGALTRDQVFDRIYREKASEYLGSAIGEKGVLALSAGAPGHHVLAVCQRYVRDHGRRRAQVEALVTAAASNPDPSAIQFVLSVARKFRQESVRLKAVELAADIADKRGWTTDELADRTIPTAGFDEDGVLRLDFGRRLFEGRVARSPKTGAFTVDLFTADGKPVKALPKPTEADDPELAGEARKQLAVSKKELSQVARFQASRLFEAMCLERAWDVPAWRDFLAGHPVMRPLIATLVWQATGPDGPRLFRPTPEGELLDAADDAVDLPDDARVALAHLATVTPAEADAWRAHLRDYDVAPLFGQFDAAVPVVAEGADQVDDHLGWLSDTFAVRGRAVKRGYSRAAAEDGAWFHEYFKDLPSAGLRVCLGFTGSTLPEEQFGAAVTKLTFERDERRLKLADVPPILLAESYADYVFVAEAGAFDPKWEDKSGY